MKISRCIKNPVLYIRKALYYAIGNTVARMFYPPVCISRCGSKGLLHQKLFGANSGAWWPVARFQKVVNPDNISFHVDDINNFQMSGTYFQAIGAISVGKGTYIAQNVGIITANHDLLNLDRHSEAKPVSIGERCWIGMNSVILPGVTLGPVTVVGAGSVVTKSFPEGYCVIAGNPARIVRRISV